MSVVNVPLKDGTAAVARAAADASAEARMFRRPSEWRIFWEAFSRDRLALAAAAVIVVVCLAAALAPVVSPYDPTVGNNDLRLAPIGTPGHLLGLDGQGRDILSRLLWGGQVSLAIALLPVTVASLISVVLGLVAGFFGGKVDMIIMRTLDVFFAFPAVLLAVAIAGVLGPGMLNVMLSITIVLIPYISRVAYMATVTVKSELFVDQARVSGARPRQILLHHILPNTLSPVIVYGSTLVGIMIVLGAGLSFLGLGITPPRPDWGIMCADGRNFLSVAPHVSAVPGIMLILVAMSFNIVGDGLRDALDPKLRK
jgi:peptide/nickel transport system permease protein